MVEYGLEIRKQKGQGQNARDSISVTICSNETHTPNVSISSQDNTTNWGPRLQYMQNIIVLLTWTM